MATFNGTKLGVYIGGTLIAAATECSLSLSAEVIDVSTKDSDAWRYLLSGMRSGSVSCSGLIDYAASSGYDVPDLFSAFTGRSALTLKFSTETSGDDSFTATAYLTSLEQSAGTEDTATFSASFELSGIIQTADIS